MKNLSLQRNSSDITWISVLIVLMTALLVLNRFIFDSSGIRVVNIYIYGELVETVSLDEATTITLYQNEYYKPGSSTEFALLDDVVIEINDQQQVRVESEESPRHICSLQGWIGTTGMPIICLPNNLMVVIEEENG